MTSEELQTAAEILGAAYRDSSWKILGFPRRPRGGSFWRRHLRPSWKNRLDDLAVQQIIATFTAVSVLGGRLHRNAILDVVGIFVDGYGETRNLYRTLGYDTRDEAASQLYELITQYIDTPSSEWSALLATHLGVFELPDKGVGSRLLVGVVEFSTRMRYLLDDLRKGEASGTG